MAKCNLTEWEIKWGITDDQLDDWYKNNKAIQLKTKKTNLLFQQWENSKEG